MVSQLPHWEEKNYQKESLSTLQPLKSFYLIKLVHDKVIIFSPIYYTAVLFNLRLIVVGPRSGSSHSDRRGPAEKPQTSHLSHSDRRGPPEKPQTSLLSPVDIPLIDDDSHDNPFQVAGRDGTLLVMFMDVSPHGPGIKKNSAVSRTRHEFMLSLH